MRLHLRWLVLLLLLISFKLSAQPYSGAFTIQTVILRSDVPSKSAVVSNEVEQTTGDRSPVMLAAAWSDSGKQIEYRSFLKFNYNALPDQVTADPSMIYSAELILYTLKHGTISKLNKSSHFIVRRVADDWNDSTLMWINQPAVDSAWVVRKYVKQRRLDPSLTVDVTKLVKEMLRLKNNGFMIGPDTMVSTDVAIGQLFASPKNLDPSTRPLLVINYKIPVDPRESLEMISPGQRRRLNRQQQTNSAISVPSSSSTGN